MFSRRIRTRSLVACVGFALLAALTLTPVYAGGGEVLPPTATPHGYSLTDMADQIAAFSTSFNDMQYYPSDLPFQIIYVDAAATNTFHVKTGTMLYVPVFWQDDTPPVVGDFSQAFGDLNGYMFGTDQLGTHAAIIVDGNVTPLGPGYAGGPVYKDVLHDGPGHNFIQVGVFLTPLSKGSHTVTITATLDGKAVLDAFGEPWAFTIDYTVIVD